MDKPISIIKLENELKVKLKLSRGDISAIQNENSYQLDEYNEVIGINLGKNELTSYDFESNFKFLKHLYCDFDNISNQIGFKLTTFYL